MIKNLLSYLNEKKASVGLSIFRILFGVILLWDVIYFYRVGLLEYFIILPATLFNYEFLPVYPLSETAMQFILAGMLIGSILIIIGLWFRLACLYMFFSLSYILLLDKGLYNNHLFLICLLLLVYSITNADGAFSLNKKRHLSAVPRWQYLILQIHIAMVYFFGGIAKINPYWFNMHPVREILEIRAKNSGFEFISSEAMEYFIMVGGLAFDLSIPFLLWYKGTRKIALILALLFNLSNAWIFRDINIFPFFMIAALILFMDQNKVLHFIQKLNLSVRNGKSAPQKLSKAGFYILLIYIIIHLYLPFRHLQFPGYVDWTGEGQHFAWRMKIQHREIVEMKFAVFDLDKREIHNIEPKKMLNASQYEQMSLHPRMLVQFAEFLEKLALEKLGIRNVMVKSKVKVIFNGTDSQYIFDPDTDLLEVSKSNESLHTWVEPSPTPKNY